ncbi:MAG: menaquinone-specific isochorismate synthase [Solirubrobacteraceae bacterium]|nr:menaquinone-specific isochorismate synthase [Solirubrobacteraceae bacterium]
MPLRTLQGGSLGLADTERERLRRHLEEAVGRARRSGQPTLAALTVRADSRCDPSEVAFASRRDGEPSFCFEQRDRERAAIATLGEATRLQASGPERFGVVTRQWRRLVSDAVTDAPDGPPGVGLVAVGGFSFADNGGGSPQWQGFAAGSLVVPEVAIARRGDDVRITVAACVTAEDSPMRVLGRLRTRLKELRQAPLPLLDPSPVERSRISSAMPPEHFEHAVASAVRRIRNGELEKVVLAREVQVHAAAPHDVGGVFGVVREGFPECFSFCVREGSASFVGASPELLVRREGMRASTMALAGSTRRSADPAVDAHLGEQLLRSPKDREEHAIVARRIERSLRPHAVWVTAAPEPVLVRVANIQHLATPVRAQLAEPLGLLDLAGMLHPTPAVGGEPREKAVQLSPALEGLDRGWYAGPVGWLDAAEDGEFCVALRSALIEGGLARCYAGNGIVADSDPAAELAETEVKLEALLPVLAG